MADSITIHVARFKAIREAEIALAPVALLIGPNGAGKSSACEAVRCALSGQPNPPGILKGEMKSLVHSGAAAKEGGYASVIRGISRASVTWPKGTATSEGEPIRLSPFAAGAVDLAALKDRERAQSLGEALQLTPTEEELRAACAEKGLPASAQSQVAQDVKLQGYDAAWASYKERGARAKGEWEAAAGERYGADKAEAWQHPNWPIVLELLGESDAGADNAEALLSHLIASRRTSLERLIAAGAARTAVDADIQTRADQAQAEIPAAEGAVSDARAKVDAAEKALVALPGVPDAAMQCPKCKAPLVLSGGKLAHAESVTAAEAKKRREKIAEASGLLERARGVLTNAQNHLATLRGQVQAGAENKRRADTSPQGEAPEDAEVEQARAGVSAGEDALAALRATRAAAQAKRKVHNLGLAVEILAPEGLRRAVLDREVGRLNAEMAALCAAAGWGEVRLESDLTLSFGGYVHALTSKSRRFRALTVLQCAVASRLGDDLVIIDGIDILQRGERMGVFKMLRAAGLRGLVTCTLDPKEPVPDISRAGGDGYIHGATYLIEAGAARRLEREAA